jgi:hypothetical protein
MRRSEAQVISNEFQGFGLSGDREKRTYGCSQSLFGEDIRSHAVSTFMFLREKMLVVWRN